MTRSPWARLAPATFAAAAAMIVTPGRSSADPPAPAAPAAASAAPAEREEIYYGFGLGPGGVLGGDLAKHLDTREQVGGRFYLGVRRPGIGLELAMSGTDAMARPSPGEDADPALAPVLSTLSLSAEVRPSIDLGPVLRLYAHGGPHHTWIVACEGSHPLERFSGFGVLAGAGVELHGELHMARAPLLLEISGWLDYSHQELRLSADEGRLDGQLDLVSIGLGFGWRRAAR